jgi:hypothetical protein
LQLAGGGEGDRGANAHAGFDAMSRKEKEQPWMVALVPLCGEVRVGGTLQPRWEEAILIADDATAEEREHFYQILIEQIKWLPPEARGPILQALGSSPSERNPEDETRRMGRMQYQIKVRKRPLKEIAASEGITVAALKKQLQRFRKRERLGKEEIARVKEEIARRKKAGAGKREK